MRRGTSFWGLILILVGLLLLLENLGLLQADIWSMIWPIFLIALGLWILWGVLFRGRAPAGEHVVIPLEGSQKARIRIRHGAGRLEVSSSDGMLNLVEGTFHGGLDHQTHSQGNVLDVKMGIPVRVFPFFWWPGDRMDWSFDLTNAVPLSIDMETGASESYIDLNRLLVSDFRLKTGASSTDLILPANAGKTKVTIESGAASMRIRVPEGVAARIRARGGLSDIQVDENRFLHSGDFYQSLDYDTAANTVDLDVQSGVGSIHVR